MARRVPGWKVTNLSLPVDLGTISANFRPSLKRMKRFLLIYIALSGAGLCGQTVFPEKIPSTAQVETAPYAHVGLIDGPLAFGTGFLVHPRVAVTAAHVIFDDDEDDPAWELPRFFSFAPRHHRQKRFNLTGIPSVTPTGFVRWDSYGTRVQNDNPGSGASSIDTFNLDLAVLYWADSSLGIEEWSEYHIDEEGEIGILRERRDKMVVGYPLESIPLTDEGFLHRTAPGNYFSFWIGISDLPQSWFDSGGYWFSLYDFENLVVYSGNSGGPIFVRDDGGSWVAAGVVVGGVDEAETSLFRSIDEEANLLIEAALTASGKAELRQVQSIEAQLRNGKSVHLTWTCRSSGAEDYEVWRRSGGAWERVAELAAGAGVLSWKDNDTRFGSQYQYRVQARDATGNRAPVSFAVGVETPGYDPDLRRLLNPGLALNSFGDNPFRPESGRAASGRVTSMGESTLELKVDGPGKLTYSWGVRSERNTEFNTDGSPVEGEIYDALYFLPSANSIQAWTEKKATGEQINEDFTDPLGIEFISGDVPGPVSETVNIPAGPRTIQWEYRKDPYSDEFEDEGYLFSVEWTPQTGAPRIYGAFTASPGVLETGWLGAFEPESDDWYFHPALGWFHLVETYRQGFWGEAADSRIGTFHADPATAPFVYTTGAGWLYWESGTGQLISAE